MCRVPRFAHIAVLIQLLVSIAAFQLKRAFWAKCSNIGFECIDINTDLIGQCKMKLLLAVFAAALYSSAVLMLPFPFPRSPSQVCTIASLSV